MKQDRRVIKTKTAIREALRSLVLNEANPKITITAVADLANIDRKTFYLHYDSVNDVVREMSRERLASFQLTLEENDYLNGPINIEVLFTALNDAIADDLDIYRHLAKSQEYSFFWDEIRKAIKETFIATYKKTLKISSNELDLCAEYFTSGAVSVYTKWLRNEINLSLQELVTVLANLNYYGFQMYLKDAS